VPRGTLHDVTARSTRRSRAFAALALLVTSGALAAPPVGEPAEPHGPVESCTVTNYEETDVPCEFCRRDDKDGACGKRLESLGYVKKCETRHEMAAHGAVWCRSKRPAVASKSEPEETQGTLRLAVLAGAAALVAVALYFRKDWAKRRT
jgi:hypothetical protein